MLYDATGREIRKPSPMDRVVDALHRRQRASIKRLFEQSGEVAGQMAVDRLVGPNGRPVARGRNEVIEINAEVLRFPTRRVRLAHSRG